MVEGSRVGREVTITLGRLQGAGTRAKQEIADYVLVYRNQKLAVIEEETGGDVLPLFPFPEKKVPRR